MMRPTRLVDVLRYLQEALGGADDRAHADAVWIELRGILSCRLVHYGTIFFDSDCLRVRISCETPVSYFFVVRHAPSGKTFHFDLIKENDTLTPLRKPKKVTVVILPPTEAAAHAAAS